MMLLMLPSKRKQSVNSYQKELSCAQTTPARRTRKSPALDDIEHNFQNVLGRHTYLLCQSIQARLKLRQQKALARNP